VRRKVKSGLGYRLGKSSISAKSPVAVHDSFALISPIKGDRWVRTAPRRPRLRQARRESNSHPPHDITDPVSLRETGTRKKPPDLRSGFSVSSTRRKPSPNARQNASRAKRVPVLASPSVAATPSRQCRVAARSFPWIRRSTPPIHLDGKRVSASACVIQAGPGTPRSHRSGTPTGRRHPRRSPHPTAGDHS
jgi:hypothetical protein